MLATLVHRCSNLHNDVRAERTVTGMKEAVSRGRWVWTAPLGYLNSRDRSMPSLTLDPVRAPLVSAPLEGKPALQAALFPEGLRWNGERFGTALTCGAFSYLQEISSASTNVASPAGFEPAVSALKGQRVGPATPWGREAAAR